ncbi:MAG: hypothetical protein WDA24_09775 [Tissierellales bacterium]
MKKLFIVLLIGLVLLLISGCTNKGLVAFNEEKEILSNEILELKRIISEKDEEIDRLKKANSNKMNELAELKESIDMIGFSYYARLDDYNHSFNNLKKIYNISSNYLIKDDWYVISEDFFQIELLGYENAKKVDFYALRMESDQGQMLLFTDTDPTDGWKYTDDNISEAINKQKKPLSSGGFSYEPYFVIYTEVTLEDGNVIKTSKLPIYNN